MLGHFQDTLFRKVLAGYGYLTSPALEKNKIYQAVLMMAGERVNALIMKTRESNVLQKV